MTNTPEKVLEKIKEGHLEPKPRWQFLLRRQLIWGVFAVSVILGALAVSVCLFILTNNDWDIYRYLKVSFWGYLFSSLPYLWLIFLSAFLGLAYYNARHTEAGYKYRAYKIAGGSLLLSIILGAGLFYGGLGEKIDNFLANQLNSYQGFAYHNCGAWNNPEKGLLTGTVEEIKSGGIVLRCCRNHPWNIEIGKDINASFATGTKIKIIGEFCGVNCFRAKEIRPWCNCGDK